jgi:hypothetical protein
MLMNAKENSPMIKVFSEALAAFHNSCINNVVKDVGGILRRVAGPRVFEFAIGIDCKTGWIP